MFGKGLSAMLKEYGLNYDKRRTNQGMQTNLALREESNADWLPKCDEPTATNYPDRHCRSFFTCNRQE
jgi:putative DNA primase/helicase